MGWKEAAEPVLTRMPSVARPEGHVPFKRKLTWTGGVLVLYFFLTSVPLWGLPAGGGQDLFGQFRAILAGSQFSVLHLGIGPIVTASIVLQLLGGANLLGLDTDDPRDQVLYQGLQKLLVVFMIILTGLPMVLSGYLPADPNLANSLGVPLAGVQALIFVQIFLGGVLILFMDEVISKWGVGSGIGLFIVANVSESLVDGVINPTSGILANWYGLVVGSTAATVDNVLGPQGQLIAIVTTVLIFSVVVYAESVRVEIPLSHARVKGARGRFPVKLIYASVLPMILVRALQANLQFLGQILVSQVGAARAGGGRVIELFGMAMPWLGTYSTQSGGQATPTGGLFYYMAPIRRPTDWMWWLASGPSQEVWQVLARVTVDLTFMIIGGAIFAIFWVETADMGPRATAKQIQNSGMQIPGFRQNVGVIEKVMERYIPHVTVIGGALVGLLAVMANMLGTIGGVSGTGLLLAVSITYKLYEEIAEEQLMEMHPMMRSMFGSE